MSRAKEQNHTEGTDDDFICIDNDNDNDYGQENQSLLEEQKQPNTQELHDVGLNVNEGEDHTFDDEEKKSSENEMIISSTTTTAQSRTMHASKDEELSDFLSLHNIHETLYEPLLNQDIRLEHLKCIEMNDLNELCTEMEITITNKIKLKAAVSMLQKEHNMVANGKMNVVLIGDSAVGKTCLMVKYTRHKFYDEVATSIGIGSASKKVTLDDNYVMELNIWDTAGQEKYNSICTNYYRRADVVMLCYAVDCERTLKNCEKWRQQIEDHASEGVCVMLIGCKKDVALKRRELSETNAKQVLKTKEWKKYNTWWAECSAQTGDNVTNVFMTAAKLVRTKRKGMKQPKQFQENRNRTNINNERRAGGNNRNNKNKRNDTNSCC